MRPAASIHFTLAILVASANGHLGTQRLDCPTLAKALLTGSTQHLAPPIREQIQDLLRKADPELVQQAWKSVGGKGTSLRKLAQEAAGENQSFPLLSALLSKPSKSAPKQDQAVARTTRARRASARG